MKTYENNNGNMSLNGTGNICYVEEFVRETDKEDGATLLVADKQSYAIVNYCIAYDGHWFDM